MARWTEDVLLKTRQVHGRPKNYVANLNLIDSNVIRLLRMLINTSTNVVCFIEKLEIKWFPIPVNSECKCAFNGTCMSQVSDTDLLDEYRANRQTLICKIDDQPIVINDAYRTGYIKAVIDGLVNHGFYERIHLQIEPEQIENLFNEAQDGTVFLVSDSKLSTIYYTSRRSETEGKKSVPARPWHHPTPVEPTRKDGTSFDKSDDSEKPLNYTTFPFNNVSFQLPLNEPEPKYSIAVSESEIQTDHAHDSSEQVLDPRSQLVTNGGASGSTRAGLNTYGASIATKPSSNDALVTNRTRLPENTSPETDDDYKRNKNGPKNWSNWSSQFRHPDFSGYDQRLETFYSRNWDSRSKPDPSILAEWGFFATGNVDLARCHGCGLGLKDWDKADDPLTEHARFSKQCPFLCQVLGPEQLAQLQNSILRSDQSANVVNDTLLQTRQNTGAKQQDITLPYPVRNPRYQTMDSRIASFRNLQPPLSQSVQSLAVAGLFYTGIGDLCRCFTCDGGLKAWQPDDDPIAEHARFFPKCPYLRHLKGDNYVQNVNSSIQNTALRAQLDDVQQTRTSSGEYNVSMQLRELRVADTTFVEQTPSMQEDRKKPTNLRSPAARAVLDMGYAREVVKRTIEKLNAKGNKDPSAEDVVNVILSYEDNTPVNTPVESSDERRGNKNDDQLRLMAERDMLKYSITCVLCLTYERNILCMPCTHLVMCSECANNTTNCPACGALVREKIRTYRA